MLHIYMEHPIHKYMDHYTYVALLLYIEHYIYIHICIYGSWHLWNTPYINGAVHFYVEYSICYIWSTTFIYGGFFVQFWHKQYPVLHYLHLGQYDILISSVTWNPSFIPVWNHLLNLWCNGFMLSACQWCHITKMKVVEIKPYGSYICLL